MNELVMALDNMVAAWACFWEGDRSMVSLRRVVTKMKDFGAVQNMNIRIKLLETFINKVLEINQRKAIQKDVPLTYKEMLDMAKEYVDNVKDYSHSIVDRREAGPAVSSSGYTDNKNFGNKGGRVEGKIEDMTRQMLTGLKFRGKEFCVNFNLKDEKNESRCKDRRCSRAHNCGFIPRGQNTPCGKPHPKFDHWKH